LIDIKTSKRNGRVIGIVPVTDADELLMMTTRGKIQRVAAKEINIIGRNTQGVKIMRMDEGDTLAAIVKVPQEDEAAVDIATSQASPLAQPPLEMPPSSAFMDESPSEPSADDDE